jgi:hypothetical protein
MSQFDRVCIAVIIACSLASGMLLWQAGQNYLYQEQRVKALMPQCEYLGRARDAHFFDCAGRIEMLKR